MTIKHTAGKILLYIYRLQRSTPLEMPKRQIVFVDKQPKGISLTSDKTWFAKDMLGINPSGVDVYNAFQYLLNKKYIRSQGRVSPGARIYIGVEPTGRGIDIVEGIERGGDGVEDFHIAFNIKLKAGTTIDSVIDDQLRMLS